MFFFKIFVLIILSAFFFPIGECRYELYKKNINEQKPDFFVCFFFVETVYFL